MVGERAGLEVGRKRRREGGREVGMELGVQRIPGEMGMGMTFVAKESGPALWCGASHRQQRRRR